MKRALRIFALFLMLLAVIGAFSTPFTQSKVAVADGMPMPSGPDKKPELPVGN